MWAFRQAVWDRCDFDPTQILWILQLIYHPILLHRVLVWWEATNKTSHVTKVTKITGLHLWLPLVPSKQGQHLLFDFLCKCCQ